MIMPKYVALVMVAALMAVAASPSVQAIGTTKLNNDHPRLQMQASIAAAHRKEQSIRLLQSLGPRERAILAKVEERVKTQQEKDALGERRRQAAINVTDAPNHNSSSVNTRIFAVIPKQLIEFFAPTRVGCLDQASRISQDLGEDTTVECLYLGPIEAENRGAAQAAMVEEILWGSYSQTAQIDGLAISVVDEDLMTPIMDRAIQELGIPVVTFDSDAPESQRSYYIGTNNSFFGRQLARQMESLNPMGGTFGIIAGESTNLQDRANGILEELHDQQSSKASGTKQIWEQLPDSPFDALNNQTLALEKMNEWASQNPTVLLSVTGLPMRIIETQEEDTGEVTTYAPWADFVDSNRHRNITLLCADASPHQLKFLEYDYIDGLAGQLPYDMGIRSIKTLWTLYNTPDAQLGDEEGGDFIGTNVLWHVHVPLKLPPITVDPNRVGNLKFVGYTLFGVTAATAIGFCVWMYIYRAVRVVTVAQPHFLIMIAMGVVVMSASMIPIGMDDLDAGINCDPEEIDTGFGHHCRAICMGVPWLSFIGFTMIFSALFSKTWRINRIFSSFRTAGAFRVIVSEKEALAPLAILMTINVTILLCWTLIDPLTFTREVDVARDEWNRVISTYGVCKSENVASFLVPLIVVNFGVLLMANWQAYKARDIQAEFAETKYIAICMGSMLQAMISGVPVLFFVKDLPQAYYMVYVLLCFIIGMVILLVIFAPKVIFAHQFMLLSSEMQKQYMTDAVGRSTNFKTRNSAGFRGSNFSSFPGTDSDGAHGMVVRKAEKPHMFPVKQARGINHNNSQLPVSMDESHLEENPLPPFERPVDVVQDRQTAGWGGMNLSEVIPTHPGAQEDGPSSYKEDEKDDDILKTQSMKENLSEVAPMNSEHDEECKREE